MVRASKDLSGNDFVPLDNFSELINTDLTSEDGELFVYRIAVPNLVQKGKGEEYAETEKNIRRSRNRPATACRTTTNHSETRLRACANRGSL